MADDGEEAHLANLKGKNLWQRHKLNAAAMNKAVAEEGGSKGNYRDLDRDHWTRREFRKSYRKLKARRAAKKSKLATIGAADWRDAPRTLPGGQPAASLTPPPPVLEKRTPWERVKQGFGVGGLDE
jgi:hypothetical protein